MRFACVLALAVCILSIGACNRQRRRNRDIERGEGVIVKPQDVLFVNFERNWRQMVSQSPQLLLPVVPPEKPQPAWEPLVIPECVFSSDAGRMSAQVTLVWNEAIGGVIIEAPRVARAGRAAAPPSPAAAQSTAAAEPASIRFDLGLEHNPFVRNYFSSALATDKLKRFSLPSNSALMTDTQAVLLSGPGLFPKLMDFRAQTLTDRDTNQQFSRQELVLKDLKQGLTYTIRMSRLAQTQWGDEQQFAFLAPVCPNAF